MWIEQSKEKLLKEKEAKFNKLFWLSKRATALKIKILESQDDD